MFTYNIGAFKKLKIHLLPKFEVLDLLFRNSLVNQMQFKLLKDS
jgi:hypothetical protein